MKSTIISIPIPLDSIPFPDDHDLGSKSIVGDLASAQSLDQSYAVQREDGSWLSDGMIPIDEFKELFHISHIPNEEENLFNTLGGFVMVGKGWEISLQKRK